MNPINYQNGQNLFPFAPRPKYRISDIQDLMRKFQIVGIEPYSKPTIIAMCEDGTFDYVEQKGCLLIFQDSFWSWVESLNQGQMKKAA